MKALKQMFSALSIVLGLVGMAVPAAAQTCGWSALGGGTNSLTGALTAFDEPTGAVIALAVFDDGTGPAVYAGGTFATADGGVVASRIAKWDGTQWSALGSGMNSTVAALTVFDDGGGPALYAGGGFTNAGGVPANRIAKWNGTQWSPLGGGIGEGQVSALTVFDDGNGPALYAGGNFSTAGGVAASRIAKWNGTQWSAVGVGMNGTVSALTVLDHGTDSALYAGGFFTIAGGAPANHIAKWDGTQWSPLGSGSSASVNALAVFDNGGGPALYTAGGGGDPASRIAKWDGQQWTLLSSGIDASAAVVALTVFDDGTGAALYAAGGFTTLEGTPANRIAKWDGTQWSPLGTGMNYGMGGLTVFHDGTGAALYAGGSFTVAGDVAAISIAKWNGTRWSALGRGMARHLLYAGGQFTAPANYIASWDGTQWSALGSGTNGFVHALTVFDDGRSRPDLYVGGRFTRAGPEVVNGIARWYYGASWTPVGSGVSGGLVPDVLALTAFNHGTGPALYAGGGFATAGGAPANGIARWDGTHWSALGSGLGFPAIAYALTVFDDGNGPALYVGGAFTSAGGLSSAYNIAKWDGAQWSALRNGLGADYGGAVRALTVFDDGRGPALYAAGRITNASGVPVNNIARWEGTQWSAVDGGLHGGNDSYDPVAALTALDNGRGPALYAGGDFTIAGDYDAIRIAEWNGAQWRPLQGGGANDSVLALTSFDDGRGPGLYAAGSFQQVGSVGASHIAAWRCQ